MNAILDPRILRVPRGLADQPPLELEMSVIDEADRRTHEARFVTPASKTELAGLFNEAANVTGKYLGWIEYEILKAKKMHDKNRARIVLGKAIDEAVRLKETGVKMNEDMREALISQDEECERSLDILNSLLAVKTLLTNSFWSFVRSHSSVSETADRKESSPTPNFSGTLGQTFATPQNNFMGRDERKG